MIFFAPVDGAFLKPLRDELHRFDLGPCHNDSRIGATRTAAPSGDHLRLCDLHGVCVNERLRLFCTLLMATPFVLLMLGGLFLAGANLVAHFASKRDVAPVRSATMPL